MVVIYTKYYQTWPWQQSVFFHLINTCCQYGNVYYVVVTNVQVLSYMVKNLTGTKQTHLQEYVFIYIETYHNLHVMERFHTTKNNMFNMFHKDKNRYKQKIIHNKIIFVTEGHLLNNSINCYTTHKLKN